MTLNGQTVHTGETILKSHVTPPLAFTWLQGEVAATQLISPELLFLSMELTSDKLSCQINSRQ